MVIPTNEELVVAREVKRFLEKAACVRADVDAQATHATRNTQHAIFKT
jgi:hypothetical protein